MVAPRGRHNLAVGVAAPIDVTVEGNAGYFLGGLSGTKDGTGPEPHRARLRRLVGR